MELIWLLGNLHPDHKTIADFRSKQTSGIHECCLDFRRFLVSSGYISGKLVAVDGSKIKANTNRDGLTLDGINRQLALLDARLEKYLHQLNEMIWWKQLRNNYPNSRTSSVWRAPYWRR